MAAKKIVVAVDASERTMDPVRLGEDFARLLDAPVVLFSAFPYAPLQDVDGTIERRARQEGRQILLEIGATMDGVEVADAQVVASNSPARELQRISEEEGVGLIVVGSTHRGRVGRVVPGAVGERLLNGSACPVAVAPLGYAEREGRELRRIGVAFDGSEEARRALDSAVDLAGRSQADLRVITVHQPVTFGSESLYAGPLPVSSVNEQLEADARETMTKAVDQVRSAVSAEGDFAVGDPAETLAQKSADVDLLVTGSRGYGPLNAVLLGGTTHRLVSAAACPVLVIARGDTLQFG
jgi:nucleotide-binding universal stress UspA family protein